MSKIDLKNNLKNLPMMQKLVLLGSFLAMISVFLPWYSDVDRYKTGTTFLGISGPLYLAGLIVFFANLLIFGLLVLKILEKPQPKIPLKNTHLHISVSVLSALMLILSSSVYFHPKFGINLTEKAMGAGMILGFAAAGLVLIGGILEIKKKEIDFTEEGDLKPLIDVENDRVQNALKEKEVQEIPETPRENKPFSNLGRRFNNEQETRDMAQESMNVVRQEKHNNTNDIR